MKKQKICITGCLGYLGSELCKLLSGEARFKQIIGIDNRFVSERVSQLRSWGIEFVQYSILEKEKLSEILYDTDIVYHLAGITDVAYTSTQSNPEQDKLIQSIGVDGTKNILDIIGTQSKLIFPSTHVVFEGYTNTLLDLDESTYTRPTLTYSLGKVQSEKDIKTYAGNYVIVRLGSVYGYSGDTMRIGIMPNLFSKIASQNGTISLFGKGVQYKSLVNVVDVVRAMKFLAEGEFTGTYHLSNENMTVKQVAELCKKINPKVTLVETEDEIPNLGYTLSNKKLLSTGFKFLYNIEDSIREMITNWSVKSQPKELEYIIRGGKDYIDDRGIITNYELTEPINLIGCISSARGSVRANHYHPIQEQKCLLISGRYVSVIKDLSYPDAPLEYRVIKPGDIAVIRPNVAHTMVFLQDSVFLNLVNGEREHSNYGITHTIPYILVDAELRDKILLTYPCMCRVCGSKNLVGNVNLGMSPLANNLLDTKDQYFERFPLDWDYCTNCYNIQLSIVVPPEKLFANYLYVSSTSPVFRKHFEDAANKYITEFRLTSDSLVLDIGSNDGVFLKPLQERGIKVVGVEPAANLVELANRNGIPTVHGFFNQESANTTYQSHGSPDLITASNVFAHSADIVNMVDAVFSMMKPGGIFIIEVQYLLDTIKDMTFDNIYHEHVNYWSVHALQTFFQKQGRFLYHVEHIDTHGGSIRCYIAHSDEIAADNTVQEFLEYELTQGINFAETFITFGKRISAIRETVQKNIKLLKEKFPVIAGYGAPAKATTALNYFGITSDDIPYTIEDNLFKQGKFIPGVGTMIIQEMTGVDLIIVFAWNFFDAIKSKLSPNIPCISIKELEIADVMPILDTDISELKGSPATGKVYDCFLFFNELDLLEMRLNILDSVVDYFVIVEANVTHSGEPREYCFAENQSRFAKWTNRIIYLKVDDIPGDFDEHIIFSKPFLEDRSIWDKLSDMIQTQKVCDLTNKPACREQWQRASIIRGLQNCQHDDVIILSDLDEITNPDTLKALLEKFDNDKVYSMRQNSYYYSLNLLKEKHWVGARIASYQTFCKYTPITFRHIRDLIIANGGWHFSFQGTKEQILNKLQAYSHSDMVTDDVVANLQSRIEQEIDPFNRTKLTRVEIDSSYPKYLLDNIDKYKHMIL